METNKDYFNYSLQNQDALIDPFYVQNIEHIVIKKNKEVTGYGVALMLKTLWVFLNKRLKSR